MSFDLPIHIIYASTSGHTEAVVDRVADLWRVERSDIPRSGTEVHLHRAEQTPIEVVKDNQFFVLATSTWEHGQINPFFKKFLKQLKKIEVNGKKAAFIGLGDDRYEKIFVCAGADKLERAWEKEGGQKVGQTLKVEGDPFVVFETTVKDWALATLQVFADN